MKSLFQIILSFLLFYLSSVLRCGGSVLKHDKEHKSLNLSQSSVNELQRSSVDLTSLLKDKLEINIKDLNELKEVFNITSTSSYEEFYKQYSENNSTLEELLSKLKIHHESHSRASSKFEVLQNVKKANDHLLFVIKEAKCEKPKPRIISIQDIIPNIRKQYVPRCTILHRCDNEAGCCDSEKFHCVAKKWQYVTLYFYTISVRIDPATKEAKNINQIESFAFQNHTSCRCEDAYDIPRTAVTSKLENGDLQSSYERIKSIHNDLNTKFENKSQGDEQQWRSDIERLKILVSKTMTDISEGFTPKSVNDSITEKSRVNNKDSIFQKYVHHIQLTGISCLDCPFPFFKKPSTDGDCSCDCFDRQKHCIRIKRGRRSLDENERRCIEAKYCHEPKCEFGDYISTHGRCPKRSERKRRRFRKLSRVRKPVKEKD